MSDTVLHVSELTLLRDTRTVLHGVSFEARRGELVAIMGPSGCGKTTALRAIVGLERWADGRVAVDGVVVDADLARRGIPEPLRRKVGMVFQFHCLFEHLSALNNVTLAPVHAHGVPRAQAEARARSLFTSLGIASRADALPRQLSGGEAQRVAIARALAVDPPVLLMDEPTASLDPDRRTELGRLLRELCAQGRTLVVATHDADFVDDFATRVVRFREGRVEA
ncbi:MAG: ATP-binding cassette domain-containing protein [Vicinamibacterales bacterium]